jgi:hypothetical protein
MVKSFKEFSQSTDAGYDWGTDKAKNYACDLMPYQDRPKTKKRKKDKKNN